MAKAKTNPLDKFTVRLREAQQHTNGNVLELGRILAEAEETCEHGDYMEWVAREFSGSHRTALRYREVFRASQICQFGKFDNLKLATTVLYMLAEATIPDEAKQEIIATAKTKYVTRREAIDIIVKYEEREEQDTQEDEAPPTAPDDYGDDGDGTDDADMPDYENSSEWLKERDLRSRALKRGIDSLNSVLEGDIETKKLLVFPILRDEIHRCIGLLQEVLKCRTDSNITEKADRAEACANST